jgi:PPOX class probable F420-dependent enzyme
METATLDGSRPKDAHIDERLRRDIIIWFSSVRPDGRPHVVPVWFLWDGESILLFSKPDQKVRNLRQNRAVVIALDNSEGGEDVILLEGEATLLDDGTAVYNVADYAAKYAALLASFKWTPESMAQDYSQAIRVRPTRFLFR